MLGSALEKYALDVKSFPTTEQGLGALLTKPADLDESIKWDGPYLNAQDLPKDPWGHDYKYEYPPTQRQARPARHLVLRARWPG